jgi:hypothetical protein
VFTTRTRKRFFRLAIDVMADAYPGGPVAGRAIVARVLPS